MKHSPGFRFFHITDEIQFFVRGNVPILGGIILRNKSGIMAMYSIKELRFSAKANSVNSFCTCYDQP